MERKLAKELKKVDIEIAQQLFSISKDKKIPAPPSPLQIRILEFLFKNQDKEINQKDIEQHICVSKATISGALISMEKNGFIKRVISEKDQRSKNITFTDYSKEAYKSLALIFDELNEKLQKGISDEELNAFYATLDKISNNLR